MVLTGGGYRPILLGMYVRETSQRRAGGRKVTYLQLAENTWNSTKGRSETRVLCTLGRGEDPTVKERLSRLANSILRRLSSDDLVGELKNWRVVDAWSFGDVYVVEELWDRLGLKEWLRDRAGTRKFGFSMERALFAMVCNRMLAPSSKLYCWEQWLREDVLIDWTRDLELHHLYRAMDFLEANREELEWHVYRRLRTLLNLDVEVIFYDTTSLHFEVDEEDEGSEAEGLVTGSPTSGGKEYPALRKRGHSKNGRSDAPQIVVGLAVTREGFPIRHWVFPGNTVDVTTVKQVKEDLRGWRLSGCVFVGDAGMVSEDNLKTLALGGGKYIVCSPVVAGGEVDREVLSRPGRFKDVASNLKVKEVTVGDGARQRRYLVCHNPEEEKKQSEHRAELLRHLEADLASLRHEDGEPFTRRMCELRASHRYGRYLRTTKTGGLAIDPAKVKAASRTDGKFVVRSNDETLTSEDLALGYKQLQRVEEAWRTLKSGLRLRPVYHWAPHRIQAHISLTVLALLLERIAEHACGDTWRNIRDDLKRVKLAQLSGPLGDVWQVTEPNKTVLNRLKLLKIKNPPPVVRVL